MNSPYLKKNDPESGPGADAAAGQEAWRSPELEAGVLLEAVIHDMRTPLSAMSGWLEVLEAQLGAAADPLAGRALKGLRRAVDGQASVLSALSDTLTKQRRPLQHAGDCIVLDRLQRALQDLDRRAAGVAEAYDTSRLAALRAPATFSSLTCADAGAALDDALLVLLQALAVAQTGADTPIMVEADAARLRVAVPGASGDPAPLRGLSEGVGNYKSRRPDLRAQSLWLARSTLHRCGVMLRMSPLSGGGVEIEFARRSGS